MNHPVLDFIVKHLNNMYIQSTISDGGNLRLSDLDLGLRNSILKLADDAPSNTVPSVKEHTIYYVSDYYDCHYVFFRLPDHKNFIFIGPYLHAAITEEVIYQLMDTLHLPGNLLPQLQQYYNNLTIVKDKESFELLLFDLYNSLFPEMHPENRILDLTKLESQKDFLSKHEFLISEEPVLSMRLLENRYHIEDDLLDAVAHGNTQKALAAMSTFGSSRIAPRLENPIRNQKNLTITLNTLLRRTAYQAGVHPFHIDTVSGNYVRFIENARDIRELEEIIPFMVKSYCNLVNKYNMSSYSEPIRQILMTVAASLTADLSLKRFANDLFLNTSYLSALFKKEVGIPLTDYVNKSRISQACKMLKSTDQSVQDIAAQIGIPDIHYFNRLFRREMGTSPRDWRINNK